jgi:hypothetical protein
MQLWKGAGPGTYWNRTNAQTKGGFHCPTVAGPSAATAVRHITQTSHPSPFTSFTTSFAVAYDYATLGGTAKGYVYEIDTSLDRAMLIHDPIQLIASLVTAAAPIHTHDGSLDLIPAIAQPGVHGAVLTAAPRRFGHAAALPGGPHFTSELRALVLACRDAELLVERVAQNCIVGRHAVP